MPTYLAALAIPLSLVTACADFTPDVGPTVVAHCSDLDSDPATPVSFAADLVPLFQRMPGGCVGCHTPAGATPTGFERSGLDVSTWQTLRAGGFSYGDAIIVPGQPCSSGLVDKLGPAPQRGARMPEDGPPFFSEAERQLVSDWIFEGALDD